jgi:hypothetical protein
MITKMLGLSAAAAGPADIRAVAKTSTIMRVQPFLFICFSPFSFQEIDLKKKSLRGSNTVVFSVVPSISCFGCTNEGLFSHIFSFNTRPGSGKWGEDRILCHKRQYFRQASLLCKGVSELRNQADWTADLALVFRASSPVFWFAFFSKGF